jgi:uncharacterized RDD family membrane protein YckC
LNAAVPDSTPVPPPTEVGPSAPAQAQGAAPDLLLRLAVMTYEAVLLFGVVFVVSYALLALAGWKYPLQPQQRWILQTLLFIAVGVYFVYCWVRAGQTLAMKSWRLRLVERDGSPVRPARALLRYLLAWSLFAPGLVFMVVADVNALWDLAALLTGLITMLALARLDPNGQLLHDRLLGTRVVRDNR